MNARQGLDALTTPQLLALYERIFGKLDPLTNRRMVATAREHGWDRSWSDDAIAA